MAGLLFCWILDPLAPLCLSAGVKATPLMHDPEERAALLKELQAKGWKGITPLPRR